MPLSKDTAKQGLKRIKTYKNLCENLKIIYSLIEFKKKTEHSINRFGNFIANKNTLPSLFIPTSYFTEIEEPVP